MNRAILALFIGSLAACSNVGPAGPYGLHNAHNAPLMQRAASAARDAALEPGTWLPLAGAAVLSIGSLDEELSEWAVRKTPLFGDNAADRSDELRDFATYSYFATALLAPSSGVRSRLSGLGVGVGTMLVEGGLTELGKSLSSRQRPNGRGDQSFPSGHAAQASTRSVLTLRNLAHVQMPMWRRRALQVGYLGLSGATAWARVEAEKHYPTDVLVGLALGQFLANFAHNLFLSGDNVEVGLSVQPQAGGGTLTLTVPLR